MSARVVADWSAVPILDVLVAREQEVAVVADPLGGRRVEAIQRRPLVVIAQVVSGIVRSPFACQSRGPSPLSTSSAHGTPTSSTPSRTPGRGTPMGLFLLMIVQAHAASPARVMRRPTP